MSRLWLDMKGTVGKAVDFCPNVLEVEGALVHDNGMFAGPALILDVLNELKRKTNEPTNWWT